MRISKKSWHCKLVENGLGPYEDLPTNFCDYMKAVLKAWGELILWGLFILLVIAFVTAFLAWTVYGYVVFAMNFPEFGWDIIVELPKYFGGFESVAVILAITVTGVLAIIASVGVIYGLFAGAGCVVGCVLDRCILKRRASKKTREPGLIRQWYKAKKEKVCPRIEYVED